MIFLNYKLAVKYYCILKASLKRRRASSITIFIAGSGLTVNIENACVRVCVFSTQDGQKS